MCSQINAEAGLPPSSKAHSKGVTYDLQFLIIHLRGAHICLFTFWFYLLTSVLYIDSLPSPSPPQLLILKTCPLGYINCLIELCIFNRLLCSLLGANEHVIVPGYAVCYILLHEVYIPRPGSPS